MKNKKILITIAAAIAAATAFSACGGNDEDNGNEEKYAPGNTLESGDNVPSGSQPGDDSENDNNDPEPETGVYIVYDLGDCPEASMKSLKTSVKKGENYVLDTPYLPILSQYAFVGWKNALTGKMVASTGVFDSESSIYLQAVWVMYGPEV